MTQFAEVEARRLAEQACLDRLKDAEERNRLGQFATPPALAMEIAAYARELWQGRHDLVHFLEPALGSGAFYSALRHVFRKQTIGRCSGVEIDPLFARAADSLWASSGLIVRAGDFSRQPPPPGDQKFNLILTNPPYVRHHHLDPAEKRRLRSRVAHDLNIKVSRLAGLYCYFLLLCDSWLDDNALSAWLIPSEFMDVNYGTAIKDYLTERVRLLRVHRFSPTDTQFGDALVTSAVVVFEKSIPGADHAAQMSFGGSLVNPVESELVAVSSLRTLPKWTRHPSTSGRALDVPTDSLTLGDLFDIRRGLATGANSFFIVNKEKILKYRIPGEFVKPVLPSPRHLPQSILEADHEGVPELDEPQWLIDCDCPGHELREQFPAFWAYLADGERRNIHKGYLTSRRTPWYSQEQRPPAPFLCTYMGRSGRRREPFRFLWNRSRATATNVWLLLYPKGRLKTLLDARPDLHRSVFAFFQEIKTEAFIDEGRVYGGGLYKLEPKELARLSAGPLVSSLGTALAEHRNEGGPRGSILALRERRKLTGRRVQGPMLPFGID